MGALPIGNSGRVVRRLVLIVAEEDAAQRAASRARGILGL
jgi:hypothetical protein